MTRIRLRNGLLAGGLVVAAMVGVWTFWQLKSRAMHDDFLRALQSGAATENYVQLKDKQWSADELATAQVLFIPASYGRERALTRTLHSRGRILLSSQQYTHQASVHDAQTGLTYLFGFQRPEPQRWKWVGLHPDSQEQYLQRRRQEVEQLQATTGN